VKQIIAKGDASDISDWTESSYSGPPADMHTELWHEWHIALRERSDLHWLVGGRKVVLAYRLMYVPPMWSGDQYPLVRGYAIGWPILERGLPVNLVRRYLDNKERRYKVLAGRGHYLWPDISQLLRKRTPGLLVCGMRDCCWARRAGFDAYTTTGGVSNWQFLTDAPLRGRQLTVCFDNGEQEYAEYLARKLRVIDSADVRVIAPPEGIKDIAELGQERGLQAVREHLGGKQW
jgi:hypothetical protein